AGAARPPSAPPTPQPPPRRPTRPPARAPRPRGAPPPAARAWAPRHVHSSPERRRDAPVSDLRRGGGARATALPPSAGACRHGSGARVGQWPGWPLRRDRGVHGLGATDPLAARSGPPPRLSPRVPPDPLHDGPPPRGADRTLERRQQLALHIPDAPP